ncbi:unnamed protein product (macronuclear) [Paramecium tetraurelia]|uniref:Uncharacterized protein n=1 Tax=Paramecium tetraurelia TaxID=5888 RepID=A0BWP4_PARTE|nr:uncharacterized protein GSPATT00032813001 [Paramecium tetraurelia]CAK62961.1 unnamed protein product [Paramecium tetraurelia]|eukprot:XP_001430359.1 hypothetical protein (macronuclear) [Paramecium tetraurelia strain d4-2]
MAKEVNREEYARQKHHKDKQKKFAVDKLKNCFPKSLDDYNEALQKGLKDCDCQKDPDPKKGIVHKEGCPHNDYISHQKQEQKLLKQYIYYKTQYNYDRDYSPEYYFARQIYQEKQADQVKIKIKQKVLKGKDFNDDHLY